MTAATRNYIINEIFHCKIINDAARNINRYYTDDLKSDFYLHLAEMEEDKLRHIFENEYYIGYALKFFVNRNNLDKPIRNFGFRNYNYHNEELLDEKYSKWYEDNLTSTIKDELEELAPFIQSYINNSNELNWYDQLIFSMYLQSGSTIRSISHKTRIPAKSIHNTISAIRTKVKHHLNQNDLYNNNND